jgi:uncharacterized protein YjbI with pentapeptide repeats
MMPKQLTFVITIVFSIFLFTGNSFGFDLGGALNSLSKEIEKGAKELEQGLSQGQESKEPTQNKDNQNQTNKVAEEQRRLNAEQAIKEKQAEEQRRLNAEQAIKEKQAEEQKRNAEANRSPVEKLKEERVCTGCNLQELEWDRNYHLRNVNLQGANLKNAKLKYTDLQGANLQDANLQGANLWDANLQGANLQGANIEGTIMQYATLDEADFRNSKGLPKDWTTIDSIEDDDPFDLARIDGSDIEKAIKERSVTYNNNLKKLIIAKEKAIQEEAQKKEKIKKEKLDNARKGVVPDMQKEFVNIVSTHAEKYKKAKNQIKKSLIRKKRKEQLEKLFNGGSAGMNQTFGYAFNQSEYWIGKVDKLTTDKDGDASVYIQLSSDITLVNNNKITPDNSMYETLAELEKGDIVIFTGIFRTHAEVLTTGYFLSSNNPTESGALTDPLFKFEYSLVTKK